MVANKNQNQDLSLQIATPLAYINSEKKRMQNTVPIKANNVKETKVVKRQRDNGCKSKSGWVQLVSTLCRSGEWCQSRSCI